ncbi:hypothetical protein GCM10009801_73080 [Streptomyces albiaxialis]|uniref:Uncharacterized protein n=1 Tax=Streptomyces albiaxialis TaxID=329523 RepID=A0ABP5IIB6_9ACTN
MMTATYIADDLVTALSVSTLPTADLPTLTPDQARATITLILTGYGLTTARAEDAQALGDRPETAGPRRIAAYNLVHRYGPDKLQPTPIRGLTAYQPWTARILHRNKRVENRGWAPPKHLRNAWILLHAGAGADLRALADVHENDPGLLPHLTYKAVVGIARLSGWHRASDLGRCCPAWGEPDVWHWILSDVRALERPVPCRGRQRLWTPLPVTVTAVRSQLGEGALL